MRTINCKGSLVDLSTPKVMGIINVTPDSFYDGGKTTNTDDILKQAERMLTEGATFLDVGGYSSRPGAEAISEEEETSRIQPAIEAIISSFPEAQISIDTFRSGVAEAAIETGATLVNDISAASLDENMFSVVAKYNIPYIMMHMRGTPQTMSDLTEYDDISVDILKYFSEKIGTARSLGINDIIVDPGFGFAKTRQQNFELLNKLELFKNLDAPLLVGISRKSMIYKTLETSAEKALNGTTSLNTIALMKGASILRVHDVNEAVQCIKLMQNLQNEGL